MRRIATRIQLIKTRARTLANLQLELAMLELKRRAKALGVAATLGIVALVAVLYALGFAFAAAAVGIAEVVPLWASLLIVTLLLLLTAALLVLIAARIARSAGQPVEAVAEAQTTAKELRDA